MYEGYFRLAYDPFSIAPNPSYLYLSEQHRERHWPKLQFVLEEGCGIAMLSGEVGTGKTTLPKYLCVAMGIASHSANRGP